MIQFMKTIFSTILGMSANICPIAKLRLSLGVNDVSLSFLDHQRGRNQLVLGSGYKADATLFDILRIQSFLKKTANCELIH
jgi:hypothetical protein